MMMMVVVATVVVVAILLTAGVAAAVMHGGLFLTAGGTRRNAPVSTSTSSNPVVYQETHNLDFANSIHDYTASSSSKMTTTTEDAQDSNYVISFTHKKQTTAQPSKTNKDSSSSSTSFDSAMYSTDTAYTGLAMVGEPCRNHVECATHACGLPTLARNHAAQECCRTVLYTTLADWTTGWVCGLQTAGAPCNENLMCATGQCVDHVCQ